MIDSDAHSAATAPTAPISRPCRSRSVLSIIALIGAFVFPPAGVIVGLIALARIKKTGQAGHGLALAGFMVGAFFTLCALAVVAFAGLFDLAMAVVNGA